MRGHEKILVACADERQTLLDISEMLGLKVDAASYVITDLVQKGYLEKPQHGIYHATTKGKKEAVSILQREPEITIDYIAYRTASTFTKDSYYKSLYGLRYEKGGHLSQNTIELGDIFKKIYKESVHYSNKLEDVKIAIWKDNKDVSSLDCIFDFEAAFEKNKDSVNEILKENKIQGFSELKLFRSLRWESFSDVERCKELFGMSSHM